MVLTIVEVPFNRFGAFVQSIIIKFFLSQLVPETCLQGTAEGSKLKFQICWQGGSPAGVRGHRCFAGGPLQFNRDCSGLYICKNIQWQGYKFIQTTRVNVCANGCNICFIHGPGLRVTYLFSGFGSVTTFSSIIYIVCICLVSLNINCFTQNISIWFHFSL